MKSRSLRLAVAIVRAWTRLYTGRLESTLREARRAEIESDLWEFQQDSTRAHRSPAAHVLIRLLLGIPADLSWRAEHAGIGNRPGKIAVLTATTAAFLVMALWVVASLQQVDVPQPPAAPPQVLDIRLFSPPPPPPPPPPPRYGGPGVERWRRAPRR